MFGVCKLVLGCICVICVGGMCQVFWVLYGVLAAVVSECVHVVRDLRALLAVVVLMVCYGFLKFISGVGCGGCDGAVLVYLVL